MQGYKGTIKISSVGVIVFALICALALLSTQGDNSLTSATQKKVGDNKESKEPPMPVVIYGAARADSSIEDSIRSIRNNRYDNRRAEPIVELPPGTEELPLNNHWNWRLSGPLPSPESDAVILCIVLDAKAYLSNDRTGVYSEFSVRVDEVLKDNKSLPIQKDDSIAVEREGGAVQFSSGRLQRYAIASQNMPLVGGEYLLFLKLNAEGGDFTLLTGYQLRKGRVFPLDSLDLFASFNGASRESFLTSVRESIALTRAHEKGGFEK